MAIRRSRLKDWITEAVSILCETASEEVANAISLGDYFIAFPSDILDLLKRKGVVITLSGKDYFPYVGKYGGTCLEVREVGADVSDLSLVIK